MKKISKVRSFEELQGVEAIHLTGMGMGSKNGLGEGSLLSTAADTSGHHDQSRSYDTSKHHDRSDSYDRVM